MHRSTPRIGRVRALLLLAATSVAILGAALPAAAATPSVQTAGQWSWTSGGVVETDQWSWTRSAPVTDQWSWTSAPATDQWSWTNGGVSTQQWSWTK